MQEFNIGDKVVCVCRNDDNWYKIGSEFTIRSDSFVDRTDDEVCYLVEEFSNNKIWIQGNHFNLVKEEPKQMFNIKTDPWFIRVNSEQEFEAIQDWLQENYGTCLSSKYSSAFEYLTNTLSGGQVEKAFVMHGRGNPLETTSRKEIKLTFKTTIDSVEYPVVETEQQIKMKQLQETIDKAARELKELREMGENK